MKYRLRVLSVNHNRILREGISVFFEKNHDFELIDSVATADAAVEAFAANRPDLTLMDLDFPEDGSLDVISRIRQIEAAAWIIGLTIDELDERCLRAVMVGVSTLLSKDQIGTMLIPVIRTGQPVTTFKLDGY
jgi:DNA-binding NarL/FixJ family response regulator